MAEDKTCGTCRWAIKRRRNELLCLNRNVPARVAWRIYSTKQACPLYDGLIEEDRRALIEVVEKEE